MEASIFIARIVSVIYFTMGLGMLINSSYYRKAFERMMQESGVLFMGGYMGILLGFMLVTAHNVWVKDWPVLITIIGWALLIKGIILLTLPGTMIRLTHPLLKGKHFHTIAVVALILGVVFGYFGFLV